MRFPARLKKKTNFFKESQMNSSFFWKPFKWFTAWWRLDETYSKIGVITLTQSPTAVDSEYFAVSSVSFSSVNLDQRHCNPQGIYLQRG